jgi:hypothetical protein
MSTATTDYETDQLTELLEEIRVNGGMDTPAGRSPVNYAPRFQPASAPVPAPAPMAQPAHEVPPAPRSRVLPRLLAMADMYLRADSLRQALEMYFDLIRSHPDTPEAILAEERVLEVARRHEEAGELHSARAIYDQLV